MKQRFAFFNDLQLLNIRLYKTAVHQFRKCILHFNCIPKDLSSRIMNVGLVTSLNGHKINFSISHLNNKYSFIKK